ncbi:hypothetical protein ADIARSV_1538 [Arcticibacter svalbardensis MN12-7]|uniref:Lipoprotein n=1 Tax=Arcticibacter svalbardensis MN12-7 TaxID=1150600 RepID=R9GTX6_9SPHI|nr:hypothetical protein [Arcticibacter svalbardensis]EOR95307.1 hypothetical protein ADIARSV_1538 [Arcticibacter svalbardensis MN12-7]
MKKRPFKNILPLAFSILFLIGSCSKEKPDPIIEKPDPEPAVFYECPDGDKYKMLMDTIVIDGKGDLYRINSKIGDNSILFKYAQIPLGICAKAVDWYGNAKFSPVSALVKTEEGKTREMIWYLNGYFKNVILPEDIKRILTFTEGQKATFELTLLNFNEDVIQRIPLVIIYHEKFPK